MKLDFNQELSKDKFKEFYIEQKPLIVPLFSILVSVFLFLFFLLPQLSDFPARKIEIDSEEKKLYMIKNAVEFARVSNPLIVDEDLKLSGQVLPVDKDFEGVLNAVSAAANSSGLVIDKYDITTNASSRGSGPLGNIPSLTFTLTAGGNSQQVLDFIKELNRTAPISEITEADYSNNVINFTIFFYYKPFNPPGFEDGALVRKMTPVEENTINDIKEWTLPLANLSEIQAVPASGAGSLNGSPL